MECWNAGIMERCTEEERRRVFGAHRSDLVLVGPAGWDDWEFFAADSQNGMMGKKVGRIYSDLVGSGEIGFLI